MTQSSSLPSHETPLELGIVLYPGMTLLDFAGPECALGLHGNTHLLWKTLEPVMTDQGISVLPTSTFASSRRDFDVLLVPGGMGSADAVRDDEILNFLAEVGKTVRYVTSVCTGSLLLGAAGLLHGYKAATHWAFYEALAATGAEAVHARVVADRNRIFRWWRNRRNRLWAYIAGGVAGRDGCEGYAACDGVRPTVTVSNRIPRKPWPRIDQNSKCDVTRHRYGVCQGCAESSRDTAYCDLI